MPWANIIGDERCDLTPGNVPIFSLTITSNLSPLPDHL
jgi:hypothetical protein